MRDSSKASEVREREREIERGKERERRWLFERGMVRTSAQAEERREKGEQGGSDKEWT